jgi:hypothetical protein
MKHLREVRQRRLRVHSGGHETDESQIKEERQGEQMICEPGEVDKQAQTRRSREERRRW